MPDAERQIESIDWELICPHTGEAIRVTYRCRRCPPSYWCSRCGNRMIEDLCVHMREVEAQRYRIAGPPNITWVPQSIESLDTTPLPVKSSPAPSVITPAAPIKPVIVPSVETPPSMSARPPARNFLRCPHCDVAFGESHAQDCPAISREYA